MKPILIALCCLFISVTCSAQSFLTKDGSVEFFSKVPLHSFSGESSSLNGRVSLEDGTVDFYIDLETLKTGLRKRDKDMRKVLGTKEFPFAEFVGTLETGFELLPGDSKPVRVSGTFSMHGNDRPIEVEGSLVYSAVGLELEAAWTIRLEDYDIEPPRLLIMKVDQEQKISIRAILLPE